MYVTEMYRTTNIKFLHLFKVLKSQLTLVYFDESNAITNTPHSLVHNVTNFTCSSIILRGPGSSVGIATGYGLDGPGIESRWG
jgi:hypothetical protein